MLKLNTIPNEFTACEEYRGHTIATKAGRYYAFKGRGRFGGFTLNRADCRVMIDGIIAERWEA